MIQKNLIGITLTSIYDIINALITFYFIQHFEILLENYF